MKKLSPHVAALAAALAVSGGVSATEVEIPAFTVRTLGAIGAPVGLHAAGNVEITGSFQLPPGIYCDPTYVTTSRANDPDRTLFTLLREAKLKGLKLSMRISDAPDRQAYPGRCSIVALGLPPSTTTAGGSNPPDDPGLPAVCAVRPYLPQCMYP